MLKANPLKSQRTKPYSFSAGLALGLRGQFSPPVGALTLCAADGSLRARLFVRTSASARPCGEGCKTLAEPTLQITKSHW